MKGQNLQAAVSKYLNYLNYLDTVSRRSPATISAYRADLRRFTDFLADDIENLQALSPPLIEHWMASMRDLSASTVRRSLNALSGLFRWAVRFGYTNTNPVDFVDRPRKKHRIQPCPSKGEIAAMRDALRGTTCQPVRFAVRARASAVRLSPARSPRTPPCR